MNVITTANSLLVALADELAAVFAARASTHDRDGTFVHENFIDLHRSGFLRAAIPARFGGDGRTVAEMVPAMEHLARGDGATAMPTAMLVQLLGRLNEEAIWPEALAEEICRDIVAHGGLVNSVVTESELGSISRGGAPRTMAVPVNEGWLVNGRKRFASGAPVLRWMLTAVTLPPSASSPDGETATAVVRFDSPGLTIVPAWAESLSLRSAGNDDVVYENVFVPHDKLIGRTPIAPRSGPPAIPGIHGWNLAIAAVYLGIGQAAVDAACDYANGRSPTGLSGRTIADLTHVQQWIGEMTITLEAARAVLYDVAEAWTARPDLRPTLGSRVAAAKYLCTNGACAASEKALRVAGGFSLTRDFSIERHFRDARAGLFHPPQDDLATALIGRTALQQRLHR
jgi:alkylation response protein AidB-like acyl-CoA dehydrogenase